MLLSGVRVTAAQRAAALTALKAARAAKQQAATATTMLPSKKRNSSSDSVDERPVKRIMCVSPPDHPTISRRRTTAIKHGSPSWSRVEAETERRERTSPPSGPADVSLKIVNTNKQPISAGDATPTAGVEQCSSTVSLDKLDAKRVQTISAPSDSVDVSLKATNTTKKMVSAGDTPRTAGVKRGPSSKSFDEPRPKRIRNVSPPSASVDVSQKAINITKKSASAGVTTRTAGVKRGPSSESLDEPKPKHIRSISPPSASVDGSRKGTNSTTKSLPTGVTADCRVERPQDLTRPDKTGLGSAKPCRTQADSEDRRRRSGAPSRSVAKASSKSRRTAPRLRLDSDSSCTDRGDESPEVSTKRADSGNAAAPRKVLPMGLEDFGDDDDASESDDVVDSSSQTVSSEHEKGKPFKRMGLINSNQACFANAGLQALVDCLACENLDLLFGEEEDLNHFDEQGFTASKCEEFDNWDLDRKGKVVRAIDKIRRKIGEAVSKGEKLVGKCLGEFVRNYRFGKVGSGEQYMSPFVIEQVLAWADPDDSARQQMSGVTQEDSAEWLEKILGALVDERQTGHADISDLFRLKTRSTVLCRGCGKRGEEEAEDGLVHQVQVPRKDSGCSLQGLVDRSFKVTKTAPRCALCKNEATKRKNVHFEQLPKNLLVKLNRRDDDCSLICTDVDLTSDIVVVGGADYRMIGAIMHKELPEYRGHYTYFSLAGEGIMLLDDKASYRKKRDDVKDGARVGRSSVVVLQKAEVRG